MLPHEKTLVERLAYEPFALIGVNSDGAAAEVLPRLQKAGINWRNAIDGSPSGEWASSWNVTGWPSLFLIDAQGVIRERWLGSPGDEVLDAKIDALVAEAKAAR